MTHFPAHSFGQEPLLNSTLLLPSSAVQILASAFISEVLLLPAPTQTGARHSPTQRRAFLCKAPDKANSGRIGSLIPNFNPS